jgi:excisionase family DNA binding protein
METIVKDLLHIGKAASLLGVCSDTLRAWEREGKISSIRTHGGHRRYRLSDIEALRGEAIPHIQAQQPAMPSCPHIERKHYAKGLCKSCYYNAYYEANPHYRLLRRDCTIKRFGKTTEWYEEQLKKGCAICGTNEWGTKGPCIDHDHSCCLGREGCGRCVRGVLCQRCNKMLGHAVDDPERLRKGIEYLTQYRAEQ